MTGKYIITLASETQLPELFKGKFMKGYAQPRVAFVGRSNVGKSTLINAVIGQVLAQTSNKPGKTRAIHFYEWISAKKIIADLPGYGFAEVSKTERDRWAELINAYLRADEGLELAVILLDARHGPTELDLQAMDYFRSERVPMALVFTKADALKTQGDRAARLKEVCPVLEKFGYDPKEAFWVSAKKKQGLKQLIRVLIDGPGVKI